MNSMNKPNAPGEGSELPALDDQGTEEDAEKIRTWMQQYPRESSAFWSVQLRLLIRERQLKAALSSPQQESAEDAYVRGQENMRDIIAAALSVRGWHQLAALTETLSTYAYVAPPVTAEGKDRG